MLNAEAIMIELGFPEEQFSELTSEFGMSQAQMPAELEYLHENFIRETSAYCSLDAKTVEALQEAAGIIRQTPALRVFFWHVIFTLTQWRTMYDNWPEPEKHLKNLSGTFYLLAALAAVKIARGRYLADGYPADVVRETLSSPRYSAEAFRSQNRRPGFSPMGLGWFRRYLTCELFRLGRFEYFLANVLLQPAVLENATGQRIVLQDPRFTEQEVDGKLIDTRRGEAEDTLRKFSLTEWKVILRSGDPVMSMHIPCGGNMTLEAAKNSFEQAFRFFHEYFPNRFYPAIVCKSWIANPQFLILLPESNLSRLMREGYLYPLPSAGVEGLEFIFGTRTMNKYGNDYAKYPHDNSVQRAMLSVLEGGGKLRWGGMMFFEDEMSFFGTHN